MANNSMAEDEKDSNAQEIFESLNGAKNVPFLCF